MRILYDHQIFLVQSFGGISRYFGELIHSLSCDPEYHVDVTAFCVRNEYLDAPFSYPWLKRYLRKHIFARKISSLLNRTNTTLALSFGQFDIFHPTYYNPYFLANLRSKPFVVTIYDMTHELFPQFFVAGDPTSARKRLLAEKASGIIAISQSTKDDIIRIFNISPDKISVVPLSGGFSSSRSQETAKRWKFLREERYLLFVGNREGYKNFNGFISAVIPLLEEDRSLKIFCAGGNDFTQKEQLLIKKLEADGRICFFAVNDIDLMHLYRNAIAFVFPSFCEGFGIPILEAFSCECPVIASNLSSLPEVGGDAAVYFDPHDRNSMLQTMRTVIADPALRLDLKKKSLARASAFSWQKTADLTKKTYQKILARG